MSIDNIHHSSFISFCTINTGNIKRRLILMFGEKLAEPVSFIGENKAKALSIHSAIESDFHVCHLNRKCLGFCMRSRCACRGTQHPVDQQLGQLGGQRVRIENCLGRFLAAVLPCLLVLFLLRLCQCCGIGVFRFQKQLVTRSLFCLVGVQVDFTREPLSLMDKVQ